MRMFITTALAVLAFAGCGSGSSDQPRVDRCVDRLLSGAQGDPTDEDRAYVRRTYCGPFASRGWVYDDGALSIAAQEWLEEGGSESCGSEQSETIPCEELEPPEGPKVIDCAILRVVRRSEVRDYLAGRRPDVECDDRTPVEQLGVP